MRLTDCNNFESLLEDTGSWEPEDITRQLEEARCMMDVLELGRNEKMLEEIDREE